MKTTADAINEVWQWLNASSLKTQITGRIYKVRRPIVNSDLEDVVVNAVVIDNSDLQKGFINVNIHAPNLKVRVSDGYDDSLPDLKRLTELAGLAKEILRDHWSSPPDYHWDIIAQVGPIADIGNHYITFRLEYYSINIVN